MASKGERVRWVVRNDMGLCLEDFGTWGAWSSWSSWTEDRKKAYRFKCLSEAFGRSRESDKVYRVTRRPKAAAIASAPTRMVDAAKLAEWLASELATVNVRSCAARGPHLVRLRGQNDTLTNVLAQLEKLTVQSATTQGAPT